ncbi:MAG TPA: ergosterol biosynthesis protein [Myxococcales bacterium]|nr:ergosterol biosynthesis protein [Myxococcales bacterium]
MSMTIAGLLTPLVIYVGVLLLHTVLPARRVVGYATDPETGAPLSYRLNGMLVLIASVILWAALGATDIVSWDYLWTVRWESAIDACVIGLVFSVAIVAAGEPRRSYPVDLFLGRLENPQLFGRRVDVKMFLYLVGATMLELNLLSFAAHHFAQHESDPSPGVALYVGLFSWFVLDYLTFERVHLYTYDLFAERVGFKLGWGCLTFYPFFYPVGLWALADAPNPHAPSVLHAGAAIVFFLGWSLARGANMQKYVFKRHPSRVFLGLLKPETVSDGERRLLCSGFWGVSRHVNYLGEILMATGLALALGDPLSPWPWLYPLYYVLLLFPRERDDDRRCADKYGALWDRYREKVPKRIIPGIY